MRLQIKPCLGWVASCLFLLLAGCANPPIVPIGGDAYMLSKEDHAGIFGSLSKLKADVLTEAHQFAASQGKMAVPISLVEKPVGLSPADWASVEYQFKLVDPSSREASTANFNANRKRLPVRADYTTQHTIESNSNVNIRIQQD